MPSQPTINQSRILANRPVGGDTYLMSIYCPTVADQARPGHFVKVRTWPEADEGGGPLLDRPLSIHKVENGRLEILYRIVGPATGLLSRARDGDPVKVSGPLGRSLVDLMTRGQDIYLAGGGIGLAPMALALDWLGQTHEALLFYGERSGQAQVEERWLRAWAPDAVCITEDGQGYGGLQGRLTAPLAEALARAPRPVFACGPLPMLAAVSELCGRHGVAAWVSLEALMACGFGVCLSCSLPLKGGGRFRVCREGPVLDGSNVDWERVAYGR